MENIEGIGGGMVFNKDYEASVGENAISAEALIKNLELVEAQTALRPETNDFSKGFMAGMILGSQRPEEIAQVIQEIVKRVPMENLIVFQEIGDAVMGDQPCDCGHITDVDFILE